MKKKVSVTRLPSFRKEKQCPPMWVKPSWMQEVSLLVAHDKRGNLVDKEFHKRWGRGCDMNMERGFNPQQVEDHDESYEARELVCAFCRDRGMIWDMVRRGRK